LALVLLPGHANPQTFEEFQKQTDDSFDAFSKKVDKDFAEFEKSVNEGFDRFVAKIDKDFEDYLLTNFGSYDLGHTAYEAGKVKPNSIPVAEEVVVNAEFIDYEISKSLSVYQGPVYPGIKKAEDKNFETEKIDVYFLAWPLYFNIDKNFLNVTTKNPSAFIRFLKLQIH